jgi:hypothetical protein
MLLSSYERGPRGRDLPTLPSMRLRITFLHRHDHEVLQSNKNPDAGALRRPNVIS